jgi:3-oxoacyl-[acyl-carrier-protein] synthase-3
MEQKKIFIRGIGSYLPDRVLTNQDLEKIVQTSDEWIVSRTGIRERRIAADDEFTSHMGTKAALCALEDACLTPDQMDCILVCSVTFDMAFPPTACLIQKNLGISGCPAMDIEAGCSGMVYAMQVASGLLQLGCYENILIIASDKLTSITDWEDRSTCVLFGDGSSAFVMSTNPTNAKALLVDTLLAAEGKDALHLMQPGGGCQHPASMESVKNRLHFLKMNGREVFKCAVRGTVNILDRILKQNSMNSQDIKYFVPHQANIRIIEAIAEFVNLPLERFLLVLHKTGNVSAGSVGIAFDHAYREKKMEKGDFLTFVTFGAGVTCAAAIVKWLK